MYEFFMEFFTQKDAFARAMRGLAIAIAAGAVTPGAQAALASALGPYGAVLIPMIVAAFGGAVAVGEKNEKREGATEGKT